MPTSYPEFDRTRLKALRQFKRLSHEAFGKKIGKTKQTIIAWEKGRTRPSVDDLGRMAHVFDVDPTSFWVLPARPHSQPPTTPTKTTTLPLTVVP